MTAQKDLKRVVRTRMQKTGESYTTARLYVIQSKPKVEEKPDYAALAGMSDEAVKKATGCTWERWVFALDSAGMASKTHREIAKYVQETYETGSWWAQSVTVGYERIRGVREKGQRCDGTYEANKSRTVGVPVATLYKAFRDARLRAKWLPGVTLTVRTATPNKSMRVTWSDKTSVDVGFYPKGADKSQVAVQHAKLASKADAERMKTFWTERLDALAKVVREAAR